MDEICFETVIDLDMSMYPSFLSSLYAYIGRNHWIKVVGYGKGHEIYMYKGKICCKGPGCSAELLNFIAGTWCGLGCKPSNTRVIAQGLFAGMEGLVISASRHDRYLIAIAAFLSRRTSYLSNVIRWVRTLFSNNTVNPATGFINLHELLRKLGIFTSYQVKQLAEVVYGLVDILTTEEDPWKLRRHLLEMKYIGPKIADATLLFGGYTSMVAPADTHLEKTARYLGLSLRRPSKEYCMKTVNCLSCPIGDQCLSGYFVKRFGHLAGWIQTASYVYWSLKGDLGMLTKLLAKYFSMEWRRARD